MGGGGGQGLNSRSVCVMLLTVRLLQHAHCGPRRTHSHPPPPPPPPCFWTPSIVRWLPTASVPHVCHRLAYSMKELWTNAGCQHELQPKPASRTASKKKIKKTVNVLLYSSSCRFLQLLDAVSCSWRPLLPFIPKVAVLNANIVSAVLKGPRISTATCCLTAGL